MKLNLIPVIVFSMLFVIPAYSQSNESNSEFPKFHLSINSGVDFSIGKSNTVLSENFTLPLTKNGFTPGIDGAWFFTKNFGAGVKYRFYKASHEESSFSEYIPQQYYYLVFEHRKISFMEKTHAFGPAFFTRWPLGKSKFVVSVNAGIMYLHNKLTEIESEINYSIQTPIIIGPGQYLQDVKKGYADHTGNTLGFTLSTGIRYQILPLIGVGISANGLFASLSKMKYKNIINGEQETISLSRKMNRIGLSASIDICF